MLRVGLTGGTACGKSTVTEMFRRKPHVHVIDADRLVHELYKPGQKVNEEVVRTIGSGVVAKDGSINRVALANIVFNDAEKLKQLEAIVHPAVVELQDRELAKLAEDDIAIVEATKMLEAGTHQRYDEVLLVVCSPEVQLQRFRERQPNLLGDQAAAELQRRIAAQFKDEQRRRMVLPNFVIENSGSREETAKQVDRIYSELSARQKSKP
jgi:dephospho-CoA kinase